MLSACRRLSSVFAAIAMLLAMASAPLQAHDIAKGPNGGQMLDVKGRHVELTAKGNELTLFLTDEAEAPITSKGASGRAVILVGNKQSTVAFAPAEPNRLLARVEAPLGAGARVVVTGKFADGQDIVARFVLK